MPELPEVEFARQCLSRWLRSKEITAVEASQSRVLRGSSPHALKELAGHRVKQIDRCGKWLLWELDGGLGLVAHLGMTGKFVLQKPKDPDLRWSRASFVRADGARIHFQDPRMFGRLRAGQLDVLRREEGAYNLGPDAWDAPLSGRDLLDRLAARKRPVKDVLMDQTVIAGIGNIQATEALWRARIHPSRKSNTLDRTEAKRLVEGIHWTLERTLAMNKGDKIVYVEESDSTENPFLVYGHAGEPCPRCKTTLHKMTIGGRTSAFCPKCQPKK